MPFLRYPSILLLLASIIKNTTTAHSKSEHYSPKKQISTYNTAFNKYNFNKMYIHPSPQFHTQSNRHHHCPPNCKPKNNTQSLLLLQPCHNIDPQFIQYSTMLRNLLTAIAISVSLTSIAQHDHIHINLKENPVLFHQTAAEYRALCYQAFNLATLRVKELPKKEFKKNKLAIITDIDETILDNSYSEAQLIKESRRYSSEAWMEWTEKAAATPVPGAQDFLKFAASRGIEIFYISNRSTEEINSTITNLSKYDLPFADSAHMLFKTTEDSKKSRREQVTSEYKVILLLGDNLNDFSEIFEKGSIETRFAKTDAANDDWGKKFIVLPNCIYGEWENAIYNYQKNLPAGQKQNIRFNTLKGH